MYTVKKTYGHDLGLSCAFRQWRATSHCNKLHGYALQFEITFGCTKLDERNWVVDFGNLKPLKELLQANFDHKVAVALDDPQRPLLELMEKAGLMKCVLYPNVGCEAFARAAFDMAHNTLLLQDEVAVANRGLCVTSVTCSEHGANSATFTNLRATMDMVKHYQENPWDMN